MTIAEFIKELSAYPQQREIYLASDSQGNNYAELES
jgi:hypothetical protein